MKKFLFFTLIVALGAVTTGIAQCISLTPLGTTGQTWFYSLSKTELSDGTYSCAYELCYQNPGSSTVVTFPSFYLPGYPKSGFTGTCTNSAWYCGYKGNPPIEVNAQFWINEYRLPSPASPDCYTGTSWDTWYNSIKTNRTNWCKSNVITVTALPGKTKKK